ncbi:hypothetical protein ACFV5J_19545 [Streptomyces zaomyceticus]|uniref:hypothetical protein n=1 Tax=Streptomyces zaomyceticus TaxID=68286 RepID=UPI00364C1897
MDGPGEPPRATPDPAKRHGRRNLALAVLAGAVIGAGAIGATWALTGTDVTPLKSADPPASPSPTTQTPSPSPTPTVFLLTGTFLLTSGVVSDGEGGCEGSDGFNDITEGAAVTVYDASGTVVATGGLASRQGQGRHALSTFLSQTFLPGGVSTRWRSLTEGLSRSARTRR